MNANDKYYTPTLDEFFIGFEYEGYRDEFCPDHKKEWIDLTFGRWTSPNSHKKLLELIESNKVRVKYLDKEDIESLGFKYDNYYKTESHSKDLTGSKLGYSITITKCYGNEYCIYHIHPDGNKSVIFRGVIKNVSILKKLLQQLNIN